MLKCAVKMYLREVFVSSTYWLIFILLLGTEYFAASNYKNPLAFIELLQFIAIPLYIFLVSTVFFIEDKVLTFELVMFRRWSIVALGRLLSLFVFLSPFTLVTLLIAKHYHAGAFVFPAFVAIFFYSTTILLSTLLGGGSRLYVLSMGLLFMLPFSSLVLIQNQANLGNPLQGFIGYIAYLFAPVYGSYAVSSGILLVDSDVANWIAFALSVLFMTAYVPIFKKREVKPG